MTNKFQGHRFKTQGEAHRARELFAYQRAGAIRGLVYHPQIRLTQAEVPFTLDFGYIENGVTIWEDFKTETDPRFKDLVRLWPVYGQGRLRITKGVEGRGVVVREIESGAQHDES